MSKVISQIKIVSKYQILIGIDPDVTANGVALKHNGKLTVGTMHFFALYDYLSKFKGTNVLVRIDAGWLNKPANFRKKMKDKKTGEWVDMPDAIKERIASKVGRNEQTGKLIQQMCEHIGLEYQLVKPERAKWDPYFFKKVTGIETMNQECIDAGRLVL